MRLANALVIIVVGSTAALSAPPKKALPATPSKAAVYYDFKGARLGMTLAEVRALPAPTNPPYRTASSVSEYGPERFLCSTDTYSDGKKATGFYLSKTEEALGVVECKYAREWKIGRNYTTLDESAISIGSVQTSDVTYGFLDGRLYEISIGGHTNLLSEVLDGLTAKFGKPDVVVNDTTQNKAGATFPHTEQTWINPVASIIVESPWTKIDNMHVSFLTSDGAARLLAKEKELNPSAEKM
jgi:hypothetical protein